MTELDGIVKRQADEAVDRVQTLAKIAQIEAALCSFIEKKASEANTVENAKAIAKVAECYFELSNRFWTSAPGIEEQHQCIKSILSEQATEWAKQAETAEEVEALTAVSSAIKKIPKCQ